jgi:DNA-binding MarR family transcriptional regulator
MPRDIVRDFGLLTLGTRMRRIGELLQANTQEVIRAFELTIPASQYPFLAALERDGPLTVGDLAAIVGITQPGATRTIGQLAEAGLVEISVADDDQRRRQVSLTQAGRDLVSFSQQTVWPKIEAAVRDLCGDLQGPLLDQLAAIEDGLGERTLLQRTLKDPEQ